MRFWATLGGILVTLFLIQLYLFFGITTWVGTLPVPGAVQIWIQRGLLAVLVYLNLAIPMRIFSRRSSSLFFKVLKYLFVLPGFTWMVTTLLMFTLFLLKDLATWILALGGRETQEFARIAGGISTGAPLIITGYGALKTARDYQVERVDIPFVGLPSGLKGFTIAHISDIHSGVYMPEREMNNILEIINALQPQMAALTGDYVDSRSDEIGPVARVFSRIRSEFGVFACMGNHDLFDDYRIICQAMRESGIQMLDNANRTLNVNGESLNVLGVADSGRYYDLARLDEAMSNIDTAAFKILLAHRPDFFARAREAGIQLQLSGHTHGGQIAASFMGKPVSLANLFYKYCKGLYGNNGSRLYVNPGVGMVFAPIRLGVPPEITLITLQQAA